MSTASEQITAEVTSWPGVEAGHGTRGEFAFTLGSRELGHLHGDHVAHFGFRRTSGASLSRGEADRLPPGLPGRPGFGARRIETDTDVSDVIALIRLNYDRVAARHGLPAEAA